MAGEGWQMDFESIYQPSRSSKVERNPKSSISFLWLERGGEWGLSPSTSPADHPKLNVIKKWAFHFIGWRGVADGVWVHQPAWLIIRSEHNPKRSISFYWLEKAGRWTLSQLTSLADHQKLNVIKNWAFHFFGRIGLADEVQVHQSARQIIRSKRNLKTSISFFLGWRGVVDGVQVHWPVWPTSEVERNKKWGFHFLAAEGWQMGFKFINQPGWSSEVEHNENMSILFFGWRQVVDGVQVHRQAWLIIRSWI